MTLQAGCEFVKKRGKILMLLFRSFIYFLSYTRSLKCGQLQELKNLSGVYVNCYRASIYIVADRCLLYIPIQ